MEVSAETKKDITQVVLEAKNLKELAALVILKEIVEKANEPVVAAKLVDQNLVLTLFLSARLFKE